MSSTTHVDVHATSRPSEGGEELHGDSSALSSLATLVNGFTDISAAEKNTAIKELTEKGYHSMYDVGPETIDELSSTAGAKSAMKRQLKTAHDTMVPTGEEQIISRDDIAAMEAYVTEGIKKKEFSWDVPLPDNKPLIDTDGQSYTWNAPDTKTWTAAQVVDVVYATKLQYGLLSGVADPSKTLLHAEHPALCLKGADGWQDVVLRPGRTFEKSVVAFSGSTYTKTFERTSASMSISGSYGAFSAHVKGTMDSQKGSIREKEEFSIVTKVSCYGCQLNLADHLAIRPEVKKEFAAVCDDSEMNSIQKHAKINGLFEKYGAFYVRQCKLGVQATGTNTRTSTSSFKAKELASTLEAGCSYGALVGAAAAKAGSSGSKDLQDIAKAVSEDLKIEVLGATVALASKFLTSLAPAAGDPRQWAVLDISNIVPIIDLFDPVLRTKVADLAAQPWGCSKVAQKTSAKAAGHPWVTVGAADIEKQLGKGYTVIGGGAWVDYGSGPGNLLTKNHPTFDAEKRTTGWTAASKHRRQVSKAVVTAYAICLKPNDPSIKLDAKVATATEEPTRHGLVTLTQSQAQRQHPGYTLVSGGGKCTYNRYGRMLTASSPIVSETAVSGWEVKAKDRGAEDKGETVVYGVMLKNLTDVQYRVTRHRSVSEVETHPHLKDLPELSTTQLVCGGGANTFQCGGMFLTQSAPLFDTTSSIPIGWTAQSKDPLEKDSGRIEAYTVCIDVVSRA